MFGLHSAPQLLKLDLVFIYSTFLFMRFDIKPKWEVIHIPETLFIWMNYDSTNKWVKTQFLNTFRIKANWHLYFSLRRNRLQEKQDTSMTKIHIYPFKNLSELLRCILPNGGMSSAAVPTAHISWTLWNLLWVLLGTESTNPKKLRVPTLLHSVIPICIVLGKDALIFREFSRVVLRFENANIGIIFVFGGAEYWLRMESMRKRNGIEMRNGFGHERNGSVSKNNSFRDFFRHKKLTWLSCRQFL